MFHGRVIVLVLGALTVILAVLSLSLPRLLFTAWVFLAMLAVFVFTASLLVFEAGGERDFREEQEGSVLEELLRAVKDGRGSDELLEKMIFEETVKNR